MAGCSPLPSCEWGYEGNNAPTHGGKFISHRSSLITLFNMLCPLCKEPLQTAERYGVEIDYCLQCRGVWLDRGELDKIIERSAQLYVPRTFHDGNFPQYEASSKHRPGQNTVHRYPDSKKGSYLDELFDFDD